MHIYSIVYLLFYLECFCWGGRGGIKSFSVQFPQKEKLADGCPVLHECPCYCAGYLGKLNSDSLSPDGGQQDIQIARKLQVQDTLEPCSNQHGRVTL